MTPAWWWGLILDGTAAAGYWALARKQRVGWLIHLAAMVVWSVYAALTRQWGFFPGIAVFIVIDVRGYRNWSRAVVGENSRGEQVD